MTRYTLLIITILSLFRIEGQTIFERYIKNQEVKLISITPKMFKMLGKMSLNINDLEAKEYIDMVNSITNFKVLISPNKKIVDEMLIWVNREVADNNLIQLNNKKDSKSNIFLFVKEGKKNNLYQKILIYKDKEKETSINNLSFNKNEEVGILIFLEGQISINKTSKLIEQFNIPIGNKFMEFTVTE